MKLVGIGELAALCDCDDRTVKKRLGAMPFEDGPRDAKLYQSKPAILKIMQVSEDQDGGRIPTVQEASRDLNIAKRDQIELQMEVLRKERIPLEDLDAINNEVFSNAAAVLKAHEGKTLDADLVNDLLGQFREIGAKVKEVAA